MKTLLFDALDDLIRPFEGTVQTLDALEEQHAFDGLKVHIQSRLTKRDEENIPSEHLWHVFSYDELAHSTGTSGLEKFRSVYLKDFIVLSSNHNISSVRCIGQSLLRCNEQLYKRLIKLDTNLDLYIFHPNYKWLFVITHEEDFGPYFAYL